MSALEDPSVLVRVPPHSIEAEQSVIGALLLDNAAFDVVGSIISHEDFYEARHRILWGFIVAAVAAARSVDAVSLLEAVRSSGQEAQVGGLAYIDALAMSVPTARHARRHAELVRERAMQRRLIAATDDAATVAWQPGDTSEKVDRIGTIFGQLSAKHVRKMPRHIGDIALERTQDYEDLEKGKTKAGWRTHIPWLNATLNGGLRPGGLYILAARPSVGKSSFAQELAMQMAADGLTALFLSQEMADSEVADRSVANMGRLSYSALLTGAMDGDRWDRASEALQRLSALPFYVDDQPSLTLRDIRLKAKSCKGLSVLVVDYLQLCAGSRKDGNRNAEIEEISRGLKALAKELGIAIVALSQLNRDVEKRATKRPSLSDLRDSGAIEQDADVVMFLWPVRDFPSEGRRIVGLGVDKNRQGRLGQVGLDFLGDVQRWTQSDADINPEPVSRGRKDFE